MLTRKFPAFGFSIAEIVVSVAILAILSAMLVPSVARYAYHSRIAAAADVLDSLGAAKIRFQKELGVYPGRLSHLSTAITAGVDETDCNSIAPSNATVLYTTTNASDWVKQGPFFSRGIPRTGFPIGIGIANDQLQRTSNNTTAGFLTIVVPGVTYADAVALNTVVDGGGIPGANRTDTSGTVRWTTVPTGPSDTVTLNWYMGIRNAC